MSNFYCAAPWRGLHINPVGSVKVCCAGNPNILGNLNDKSIEEILNGPELTNIRSLIKQGKPHAEYCHGCVMRESKGADSERNWHNNVNEDLNVASASLEYQYPTLIDVRWNTTCNQSCNYCNAKQSSKWADIFKIPVDTRTRHYYEDVCDFLNKHKTHIKEVALVGGEPLLLKENSRLLDVIPNDCVVTVITNLNVALENNEIFKKLQNRSRVGWSISFDNIGKQFEYVRHGGSWDLMLHNLDLVQNLMQNQGHWGGIHAVYNLYNATRLLEFKQFAANRGLIIRWQNLHQPNELDTKIYGNEIATLAANEIDRVLKECTVDPQEKQFFETTLATYRSCYQSNPTELAKLKTFVETVETKYHPDTQGQFAQLWPELASLL
jgi:MoaA/NifB/PqqE/SkfB family radical SAM enzyme